MKKIIMAILMGICISAPLHSFAYDNYDNNQDSSNNNYTIFNSDGTYSQISKDYNGGSTVFNSDGSYSKVTPNYNGGYTIFNSNGTYSTVNPN